MYVNGFVKTGTMRAISSFRCLSTTILTGSGLPPSINRKFQFRIVGSASSNHRMEENKRGEQPTPVKFKPEVNEMQRLINSDSSGGWDKCWELGLTPWDLGKATPVILHLHQTGALPKGRALVPGCGRGHDVVAIAGPDRYVVGLDRSEKAIEKAVELSSSLPNANYFTFLAADFFTWQPTELFDLIFDYTFFCALEPELRPQWGRKIGDLLKPEGELITLIYPIDDHDGGPPYRVSVSDYEDVLHPMGFRAVSIVDNELAIQARKGREKLGWWKRRASQSSL